MAIFNEILVGRYNRALQKIFAIKGSPPVRQLGGEITPTIDVRSGVENRFIESWYRYQASDFVQLNAGNNGSVRLRVARGSNIVAVLEKLTIGVSVAQNVFLVRGLGLVQANDLPTILNSNSMDTRQVAKSQAIASSTNVTVAGGTVVANLVLPAGGPPFEVIPDQDHQMNVIAKFGSTLASLGDDFLEVRCTAASQLSVYMVWRERVLEESEYASQ